MKNGDNILTETHSISTAVANLPKHTPFSVPLTYFEKFPIKILNLISKKSIHTDDSEVSLLIDSHRAAQPFSLPDNYFESFNQQLVKKIAGTSEIDMELLEHAPSLVPLRKENPYNLPLNYFEQLDIKIESKNTKVVRMFNKSMIIRFAAAACILGAFFISYYSTNNVEREIASVTKIDADATSNLTLEGMFSYLNEVDDNPNNTENELTISESNNLLVDLNQETIQQVLSEIHEEEIQEFIELSGISDNNNLTN
jgi:hypothetical protein